MGNSILGVQLARGDGTFMDEAESFVYLCEMAWQSNPKRIERMLFGIEEE